VCSRKIHKERHEERYRSTIFAKRKYLLENHLRISLEGFSVWLKAISLGFLRVSAEVQFPFAHICMQEKWGGRMQRRRRDDHKLRHIQDFMQIDGGFGY
jgi:hypothetical protein